MFKYIRDSLLLRAGLAMGIVTFLAIVGMVSAIYIARSTHGEAGAVNLAGSLRMQSYRITTALEANTGTKINALIKEFEQRLHNPILSEAVEYSNRQSLQQAYVAIKEKWYSSIIKIIDNYVKDFIKSSVFHAQINDFVADIDHMVRLLEQDAESSIHLLGLIQLFILFLTLIVAIATLYLLHTDVLSPLHDLLNSAERASHGDFSVRVANVGTDELGRLGLAFNHMAGEISKMYDALEERVAKKTEELTLRNNSLELLYTASEYLTKAPVSETTYHELLSKIGKIMHCRSISLCTTTDKDKKLTYKLAQIGSLPSICNEQKCTICLADNGWKNNFLSIPVCDQEHNYGILLVQRDEILKLQAWQTQVLKTLGKHIGLSIGISRRIIQNRRLALLDERSVIARELHDSLAQSLSYLKIQVTRLFYLKDNNQVDEILAELKEGLDSAYRQLRELLTTFRLQIDGHGLASALSETVTEFNTRAKGKIAITLDNQMKNYPFSVNEEIHILQIVREALSNVVHHSHASSAQIKILQQPDDHIIVIIEDNGIGISQKAERTHHYGLIIMHERAKSLNADLQIENSDQGGTKLTLKFQQQETINV